MPRLLTCPQGHQWELPETDSPSTTGLQVLCPVCGIAVDLRASPPAEPASADTGLYYPAGADQSESETLAPKPRSSAEEIPEALPAPEEMKSAPQIAGYEIVNELGRGGMGRVYKARQTKLERYVALKILPQETSSDSTFAERFMREARALARLNHSNIVAVYDFGQAGSLSYFVMEFVDGTNLRQLIRSGRIAPQETLRIMSQICDALQYAHDEGIVHRDIKPENILRDKRGRAKIADFGIAKLLARTTADYTLTGPWQLVGTFSYMAPEQIESPQKLDHRADIYSLGVMFYEMLTGGLPMGRFALPSQKVAMDRRIDEIVLKALEKEPERRYQHAHELKAAIDALLAESGTRVRPPTSTAPVERLTPQPGTTATWPDEFPSAIPVSSARERMQQRLRGLPLGLKIAGILDCIFLGLFLIGAISSDHVSWMFIGLLGVLKGILIIVGAQKMQKLENYPLIVLSGILAMVPCSPGFLVGLPTGILTLLMLRGPETAAAFEGGQPQVKPVATKAPLAIPAPKPVPPPRRKGIIRKTFGTTTGWAMIFCLLGGFRTFFPWMHVNDALSLGVFNLSGYETTFGVLTTLTFVGLFLLLVATGFLEPIPLWRPLALFLGGIAAIAFPLVERFSSRPTMRPSKIDALPKVLQQFPFEMPYAYSLREGAYMSICLGFGLLFLAALQLRGILMRRRESA
jgi:serine/threonine protein kinase